MRRGTRSRGAAFSLLQLLFITVTVCPAVPHEAADRLSSQVIIRRDTYGVPHILAKSEEAAAFGFGYAQAEDHGLILARMFVAARGEEARYFGTGQDGDFLTRLYDNPAASARDLGRVGPLYRRLAAAYAAGVNHYFRQHRSEMPPWVPMITAADVLAQRRAGAIRTVHSRETLRSLQKKYPEAGVVCEPGHLETASPFPMDIEAAGSNAFALAGSRTASGRAILLGNPHLNWNSLYWEAHVTVPGTINFFGSTLAGIPVLRAGFNEHLGWVTTNNAPDLTDVFALKMDPDRADHYLFNGRSLPLTRREIEVEIREADGKMRRERRIYWDSHVGKILYRTSKLAFAVRSTLIDAARYYEGFYILSKSRSLKEFRSNLEKNYIPTSNFTYADTSGNIFYQWNARVPRRVEDGTSYRLDIPAETGKYLWKKYLKVRDLPSLLNPDGGYIQNCNNPPWFTSLRQPIDPQKFPTYLEETREVELRPQMALEMLEGGSKFSLEDVKRLKYNTRMLLADRVKPDLLAAVRRAAEPSRDLLEGMSVLEAWDNRVSAASRGGVLFRLFWDKYSAAIKSPFAIAWDPRSPAGTPAGISDPAAAARILEESVREAKAAYGTAGIPWGEVHRFHFGSLDLPGDGASGAYGLFRVLRFVPSQDGKFVAGQPHPGEPPVGFGDAWVLAVEFSKPVVAYSIVAYGQSTRADSKHSSDQIRLFAAHDLKRVWFSEADIRANLEREYHP